MSWQVGSEVWAKPLVVPTARRLNPMASMDGNSGSRAEGAEAQSDKKHLEGSRKTQRFVSCGETYDNKSTQVKTSQRGTFETCDRVCRTKLMWCVWSPDHDWVVVWKTLLLVDQDPKGQPFLAVEDWITTQPKPKVERRTKRSIELAKNVSDPNACCFSIPQRETESLAAHLRYHDSESTLKFHGKLRKLLSKTQNPHPVEVWTDPADQ